MSALRAFRYHRVSDLKSKNRDDKYSMSEQENMTAAYCKEHGYEDIGGASEFHSGAELDERVEMTRVRGMIARREIDVLVLIKLDRLARNQRHQEVILYEAAKYEVRVELVLEQYEDTAYGRQMQSLSGFVAEINREHIRENTQRGIKGRIGSGKIMPGSRPLYGYSWSDPGKSKKESFVVNEETAAIVRRIFSEAAQGKPMRRIAIDLTREGVLSPSDQWRKEMGNAPIGAPWQKSAIWRLLGNPSYTGKHSAFVSTVGKRKEFDEFGQPVTRLTRKWHDIGDEHRVMLPDVCPPIISEEVAQAVQRRLEQNREAASRNNKNPQATLLRGGFIKCASCHRNMTVGYDSTSGAVLYHCYRPTDKLFGIPRCKGTRIVAGKLDTEVWAWVFWVMQHPEMIEEQIQQDEQDGHNGFAATIEGYEANIAQLTRRQSQLSRAIGLLDESETDALLAEYRLVGKEKARAEEELAELQGQQNTYASVKEQMRETMLWSEAMTELDWTYERKRQALYGFSVQIDVWPVGVKPRWKIGIGNQGMPLDPATVSQYCVSSGKPEGHARKILEYLERH